MEFKSTSITLLLLELRELYQDDWKDQRKKGLRHLGPSMERLKIEMNKAYPSYLSEGFFKKIYIYANENPVKEMELSELDAFLRFLYIDKRNEHGWPKVSKAIKDFEDGRFYTLVEKYSTNNDEVLLKEPDLVLSGATPGHDLHTQLLELVIKAKKESEFQNQKILKMSSENQELRTENGKLKAAKQKKETLIAEIQSMINILSKSKNQLPKQEQEKLKVMEKQLKQLE